MWDNIQISSNQLNDKNVNYNTKYSIYYEVSLVNSIKYDRYSNRLKTDRAD